VYSSSAKKTYSQGFLTKLRGKFNSSAFSDYSNMSSSMNTTSIKKVNPSIGAGSEFSQRRNIVQQAIVPPHLRE
jgi:hypothetical protein